jgi:Ca2+-binding RTX toxin-like protein
MDALESRKLLTTLSAVSGETYERLNQDLTGTTFNFNAQAGETVLINVATTSNVYINVFDPADSAIYSAGGGSRILSINITATGAYRAEMASPSMGTVDFWTTIFIPSQTQAGEQTAVVESGRRRGWNTTRGDIDILSGEIDAGQRVFFTFSENSTGPLNLRGYIFGPSGTILDTINTSTGATTNFTASAAGTYHFVLLAQDSVAEQNYGASIVVAPGVQYANDPDTLPLAPGVSRDGDMPTGDLDAWNLDFEANTDVTISVSRLSGSNLNPEVFVYAPDGSLVASQRQTTINLDFTTGVAGVYTIVMRDDDGKTGGTFRFRYDTSRQGGGLRLVNNVLRADGTSAGETIEIVRNGNTFTRSGSVSGTLTTTRAERIEIDAGGGNDLVRLTNAGLRAYVFGGDGDDTIHGSALNDTLSGGAGRNRLFGGDGNDRLNGSSGRDFLFGEAGDDRLYGNGGNDELDGGGNIDRLFGGIGDDLLIGGSGNDKLYGEAGNDTLFGGRGIDVLDGGANTDSAEVTSEDLISSIEIIL